MKQVHGWAIVMHSPNEEPGKITVTQFITLGSLPTPQQLKEALSLVAPGIKNAKLHAIQEAVPVLTLDEEPINAS